MMIPTTDLEEDGNESSPEARL